MTGVTEPMVWFLITLSLVLTMITVGIYEAIHSYDKAPRPLRHLAGHHHWWQGPA